MRAATGVPSSARKAALVTARWASRGLVAFLLGLLVTDWFHGSIAIDGARLGLLIVLLTLGGVIALATWSPFVPYVGRLVPYRVLIVRAGARVPSVALPRSVRAALFAVRSELAACGTRIVEALERNEWWNPDNDPLPAIQWHTQLDALSDPALPAKVHEQIEFAYQRCDRLNHRIRRYISKHRESQVIALVIPSSVYRLENGDADELRQALKQIDAANSAISRLVEG